MAKNTKFDCIENYVKKTAGTKFYEHADSVVMWRDNIKNYWQFFKDNQWIKVVNNLTMERGNWECDGADGFIIISRMGKTWKTSDPTWKDTPEATAEGNPMFNCVRNKYADDETVKFTEYPNKLIMTDSMGGGYRLVLYTNGRFAYFENNSDGKEEFIGEGDWKCEGERDYDFTFDDKRRNPTTEPGTTEGNPIFNCVKNYYADFESKLRSDLRHNNFLHKYFQDYMSITSPDGESKENFFTDGKYEYFVNGKLFQVGNWRCKGERDYDVDESKPTQSEPTYDKSKFPLKLDSRGPEVVQLQNYLNKLIPMDPLVVNGIFNKKTQDKLIQLQKNLNLTK
jgi:hypothetical protein